MKKILYILDTFETGGAEKSLLDIARHNQAVESVFATIYEGNQLAEVAKQAGIKVYQLNLKDKYGFSKAAQLLKPIIEQEKPDLIHATLFRSDIISRKLKNHFAIPLVSSLVNNSYIAERYSKLGFVGKLKLYGIQYYDAMTAKKVDFFISNSETIKQSNAKVLGLDLNKIEVIFRGRAFSKYQSVDKTAIELLKTEFGLTDENQVFLNVSRLLDRKGQLDLIEAVAKIKPSFPTFRLLIAGEGPFRPQLEAAIKQNQLEHTITLLGNRNDIPNLLKLADAFVFPTHYEGLPGALIEAMMSECTIICSDIDENKECATASEVLFFTKGNCADLVEKMKQVLDNPTAFVDLGKNAKAQAFQKFSIEKVVEQYNVTYSQIIKNFAK